MSKSFNKQPQFFPDPFVEPGQLVWVCKRAPESGYCLYSPKRGVINIVENRYMIVIAVLRKREAKKLDMNTRVMGGHVGAIALLDPRLSELFFVPRIVHHGFRWPELLEFNGW